MVGGFIVTGNEPKQVIIRGIGPSLTNSGVPGAISDPILRLFGSGGSPIAVNDNWQDTQRAEIEATGIAPQDLRESAIVATLPPAAYTATVSGMNAETGVGWWKSMTSARRPREAGNISHTRSVQLGTT